MKFTLHDDEKILLRLKPQQVSSWYWVFSRMWHGLFVIVLVAIFLLADLNNPGSTGKDTLSFVMQHSVILSAVVVVLLVLMLLGAYVFFRLVVRAYDYCITNQRVIISYGFLSINHRIIPLSKINDVNTRASLFERLFGIVSVYLDTLGTLSSAISFGRRSRAFNNSTRFEGLTPEQADEAMTIISSIISKRQA